MSFRMMSIGALSLVGMCLGTAGCDNGPMTTSGQVIEAMNKAEERSIKRDNAIMAMIAAQEVVRQNPWTVEGENSKDKLILLRSSQQTMGLDMSYFANSVPTRGTRLRFRLITQDNDGSKDLWIPDFLRHEMIK